jgi:hypothetical protein
MQEVLEGLTSPLDEGDLQGLTFERTTPRLVDPDTEDNLQRLFEDNHWTDALPIVLPTEARVEAMLKGTSHPPDKIVGAPPTALRECWEFTVEKVAVNAVMAGARPEYFPVILALASSGISREIEQHQFVRHDHGRQRSDPQRARDELRHRRDGPYNHANATIGRAYGLLSQNLQGGSVPDDTYMGSLGNWYAYTAVLPRRGAQSLAAAARAEGFKPTDSVASIFFGGWYTHAGLRSAGDVAGEDAPLARGGRAVQSAAVRDGSDRGARIRRSGLRHEGEADRLVRRQRADDRARVLGTTSGFSTLMRPRAVAGVEPYASRLKAKPDEVIKIFEPSENHIVVAGGETQGRGR